MKKLKKDFDGLVQILKPLQELSIDALYKKKDSYFEKIKSKLVKAGFSDQTFKDLTVEQRRELKFGTWSKESVENGLIPLYIFKLLDDQTLLYCPLSSASNKTETRSNADDDTRFGCVAYEFA